MWRPLIRHPDTPCDALTAIAVAVERPAPAQLVLRYRLKGVGDTLVFPAAAQGRADELWRHTCLEAFVCPSPGDAYCELNMATGGQWAAYHFDDYRHDMTNVDVTPPALEFGEPREGTFDFAAVWELDRRPLAPWRIGMSAVIEERGGRTSYWALAHPAGKPDFHNADCFVLELPAPEGP